MLEKFNSFEYIYYKIRKNKLVVLVNLKIWIICYRYNNKRFCRFLMNTIGCVL